MYVYKHSNKEFAYASLSNCLSLLVSEQNKVSHCMANWFQAREFEQLRSQFEQNQEKQLSLMDQFHPTVIQNNLKVAILEADEESEKIVEEFLDSKFWFEGLLNLFLA